MPDAGYEEEQAADGAINGSVASDATNESAAATASAASTFMRILELRQRLFSMMSFPELAVMFRVSAGLASDVARSCYAEVDYRDLEKRMSQNTPRSATYRHAVKRVVLAGEFVTSDMVQEAKATDWTASSHLTNLRRSERLLLVVMRRVRAKCPNVRQLVWPSIPWTIDLGDYGDLHGEIQVQRSVEIQSDMTSKTLWSTSSWPPHHPYSGLLGYSMVSSSVYVHVHPSRAAKPVRSEMIREPILSMRILAPPSWACTWILDLPRRLLQQTGEDLSQLAKLLICGSGPVLDIAILRRLFATFASTSLTALILPEGVEAPPNVHAGLLITDFTELVTGIATHFPALHTISLSLNTRQHTVDEEPIPIVNMSGLASSRLNLKLKVLVIELTHAPRHASRIMNWLYQCSSLLANKHTVRIWWRKRGEWAPLDSPTSSFCSRMMTAFQRHRSITQKVIDLDVRDIYDLGVTDADDVPLLLFDSQDRPIPILDTLVTNVTGHLSSSSGTMPLRDCLGDITRPDVSLEDLVSAHERLRVILYGSAEIVTADGRIKNEMREEFRDTAALDDLIKYLAKTEWKAAVDDGDETNMRLPGTSAP